MNIKTVAQNLRNTIASKEALLKDYQYLREPSAVRDYLEVNIDELKRILKDVESCSITTSISYDTDPMVEMFQEV